MALALLVAAQGMVIVSGKFNVGVTPSVVAVTIAILVWAAVRRESRWLGHPGVAAVGIGSYGVYLWQELFLNPRQHEWWTAFPQNVLLVALAAFVSYRVIERPFLRLKDRTGPARSGDRLADVTVKTDTRCETDPTSTCR